MLSGQSPGLRPCPAQWRRCLLERDLERTSAEALGEGGGGCCLPDLLRGEEFV